MNDYKPNKCEKAVFWTGVIFFIGLIWLIGDAIYKIATGFGYN